MAYVINLTNGTILTTVPDGTYNDTACSLTLVGKKLANYGEFLNEDMVHLLENFASSAAPVTPLTGQLWFDSASGNIKVYTGTVFKTLGSIISSTSAPLAPIVGNGWWDTTNSQFKIYNGSVWVVIGPVFPTSGSALSSVVVTDSGDVDHNLIAVTFGGTVTSYISGDAEFTPKVAIPGFSTIKPGYNLSTAVTNNRFVGIAEDSDELGGIVAANYARKDIAVTFANTISINNNDGLIVGTGNNFTASVNGTLVQLRNNVNNANIAIVSNVGGSAFTSLLINGQNGTTIAANLITTAINASGYITATQGDNATSAATGALRVIGGIGLTGNIFANGTINSANVATGNIVASSNISAVNYTASGSISAVANVSAQNMSATTLLTVGGNISAANVIVTSNVTTSNVRASGTVVVTNAVTAANFFFSNGSSVTNNLLPTGMIVMWSGSLASIPIGWVLCNGLNGTPDLRDRFIIGAGTSYSPGATGGSADATLPSHTHSATSTVTDPGHAHALTFNNQGDGFGGTPAMSIVAGSNSRNVNTASTGITVATAIGSSGTSAVGANLPPYYALAFIMKT